ncbi:MobF family relaxase [Proteus sp. fly-1013]|uniref:MobF family relaxase n=1 Tax=Proteus sp. fly-1013 TaxID=3136673 RepID=UPI0032DB74C7
MLSLSTVSSSGGASNYYEQSDNYYFLGDATTQWFGKGAEKLGLHGNVNRDDFINVLEGKLTNGQSLEYIVDGKNKHRPGYDLTFSAPKSVSVLALVMQDKDVLNAHINAVNKTLTEIEKMASSRIMEDGISGIEETGNITSALFLHDTNRNLEPHLHTHAIMANITETESGKWKTLSTDRSNELNAFIETIWKNPIALGSLYRQYLKPELKSLGYSFVEAGKNGQWEIEGVPTDEFSSRRKEIIDAVGEDATAKQKSVATKDTRKKKDFSNIEEVREEWKKKLANTGFKHDSIKKISSIKNEELHDISDVKDTVKKVILNLESNSAKFTHDKIMTNIINSISADKINEIKDIRKLIKKEVENGILVPLSKDGDLYTTIKHLKNETEIIRSINQLNEKTNNIINKSGSKISQYLSKNERSFYSISLIGNNEFKKNIIGEISDIAEYNKKKHIVIVNDLKSKKFIENSNKEKNLLAITANEFLSIDKSNNNIVSLYQAERFSLSIVKELLNKVENNNDTFISIDTKTKNNEGIFTDVLNKMNVENFNLYEKNENKKTFFVNNIEKNERINLATKQFITLSLNNKDTIIQVSDSKTKNIVNNNVRKALVENGFLSKDKVDIKNENKLFLNDSNRNLRNTYKKGYFLENTKSNVKSEIIDINKNTNVLFLQDEKGNKSQLPISNINNEFNLIERKKLELRIGDKLKTYKGFNNVKGNSSYSVVGFKKGNFIFGDKVIIENENGDKISINPMKNNSFHYDYCETYGSSLGNDKTIIAIMNEKDVTSQNINKIKNSGNTIIAITGLDKEKTDAKIGKADIGIRHIPNLTGSIADTLKSIDNLKNNITTDLEKIISLSIDKASSGKVIFNGASVMMNANGFSDNVSVNDVQIAFENLIKSGEIIPISTSAITDNFIKKETFDNELSILKKIFDGKNTMQPLVSDFVSFENTKLTNGQKLAGEMILKSKDNIIAIQGYAGVGKTTQFKTIAQTIGANRQDIELRGLAPTHKAVSELKSAGIASQTIASFINDISTGNGNTNYKNSVFIIDEMSMSGNKSTITLINNIIDNGGRIILSGDKDQLKSFENGAPFKLTLERSVIDNVVMKEIVRQSPELKPAIEKIISGKIRESLDVIDTISPLSVPRINDKKAIPEKSIIDLSKNENSAKQLIIDDFTSRTHTARNNTFIITPLNSDRNEINAGIHKELCQMNEIKETIKIPTLERVNSQEYDLRSSKFWNDNKGNIASIGEEYFKIKESDNNGIISLLNLSNNNEYSLSALDLNSKNVALYKSKHLEIGVGEKVRLTVTDKERNAFNNDIGTVVSTENNQLLVDFEGKKINFSPFENISERHLDYSYAITSYSSQGTSIPYVIIYDGLSNGKKQLSALDNTYVELSRSKEHVQIYVDNLNEWVTHIEKNSGTRLTAHDVLNRNENISADRELEFWKSSKLLPSTLMEKTPELLHSARFNENRQELLLEVHNDYGVHRGNYHIPMGIFSGAINMNDAYYKGASDGHLIVINKGQTDTDVVVYPKDELEKIINSDINESVIIDLNEKKEDVSNILLLKENEINLDEILHDILDNKKDEKLVLEVDEAKEIIIDNVTEIKHVQEEKFLSDKEIQSNNDNKNIKLDEENILKHTDSELRKDLDINL